MFGLDESFNFLECGHCGCLQLIDEIEDMSKYYPENYYSFNNDDISGKFSLRKSLLNQRNKYDLTKRGFIGKILSKKRPSPIFNILGKTGIKPSSKIMDVGCGKGHLLFKLHEIGFTNLLGVDPFLEKDITYDNGLQIQKKELKEIEGKWDLIMLHHSFEHMINPMEVLHEIASRLSDEGVCLIRIPVASSYAWEHYREDWIQVDPPRHYFLHSEKSMQFMAEKAGLVIDKIIHDSNAFQFWGSEQAKEGIAIRSPKSYAENPKNSIFTEGQISEYLAQAKKLNAEGKGDQCAFFLRKTGS